MKGVIFTEFLEMVEARFGFPVADEVIMGSGVASGGAYTAVGTYDHGELIGLVDALGRSTGLPLDALYLAFGEHMFDRFTVLYPQFFRGSSDSLDFLAQIEDFIHVEVQKIYPDAELPSFLFHRPSPDAMEMEYQSKRGLGVFAEGLIRGCARHFGDTLTISREDLPPVDGESRVLFRLARHPGDPEGGG